MMCVEVTSLQLKLTTYIVLLKIERTIKIENKITHIIEEVSPSAPTASSNLSSVNVKLCSTKLVIIDLGASVEGDGIIL